MNLPARDQSSATFLVIFVLSGDDDGVSQSGSGGQVSPVPDTELALQTVQSSHLLPSVVNLKVHKFQWAAFNSLSNFSSLLGHSGH